MTIVYFKDSKNRNANNNFYYPPLVQTTSTEGEGEEESFISKHNPVFLFGLYVRVTGAKLALRSDTQRLFRNGQIKGYANILRKLNVLEYNKAPFLNYGSVCVCVCVCVYVCVLSLIHI